MSWAAVATLASFSLLIAGCSKSSPGGEEASPTSTEPVGVTVDEGLLPEVEGEFAESATILFPLKPGETRPTPTPTPEPEAEPEAEAEPEPAPDEAADGAGDEAAGDEAAGDEAAGDEAAPTDEAEPTDEAAPPDEEPTDEAAPTDEEPTDEGDGEEEAEPEEPPSPYLDPPETLQSKILKEGTGEVVKAGQLLSVFYRGQIWGQEDAFDENFESGGLSTLRLQSGMVINGWVRGLQGKKVGSRVLLVVPPAEGYGITGDQYGIIKGTDTLAFVVDILYQFDPETQAQEDAKFTGEASKVRVSGELGAEPTIQTPAGIDPPEDVTTTVIAEGTGDVVEEGDTVLIQFKAIDWSGNEAGSSWFEGAGATPLDAYSTAQGDESQVTPFSSLVGKKVGSRVLVELPGKQDAYQAVIVVIDIVMVVPKG
ncbi:MAG: FKBP-type peptidyl-prolyl cis-trans isomerase [Micrococcales bacterium]|nr:FKBP-type peptidyl-prolyl cis-trans isomerase [Micrococcales bacterium]